MSAVQTAGELAAYGLFVDGAEVGARGGGTFASLDPTVGRPWAQLAEAGAEDVDLAVQAASRAFGSEWGALTPTRRGRLLMRLADLVLEHADEIAAVEVRENGKLLREMQAQLRVVPDWLYYFGGLADKVEGRVVPLDKPTVLNYTLREPLGVVAVITPWNSPVLLTTMAAAPALAAGNTVVVKPSEVASASLVEVARLTAAAGFPPGVFNVVTGGPEAGEALVTHQEVAKVSFTGGTETGRRVAAQVAGRLGRFNLELGGKSPNIVFADADLDAAEAGVVAGIYAAGGQSCIAGSRAFLEAPIYDELLERLVHRATSIRLGDPKDGETQLGPVATERQLQRIESLVAGAVSEGARVLAGGERASDPGLPSGFFYRPTILADAASASAIAREEVFGPVLVVFPFETEDEVVHLANATPYGLSAGLWTSNVKRAHRLARELEAGTVWINLYRALAFNSPFGGYKDSGIGRLNGIEAMDEYLQTKSVWCELSDEVQDPFVLKI